MAIFSKKKDSSNVKFDVLPNHLGIIMDGNGRWAKKRGLVRTAGHKAGAEVFRDISHACGEIGIPYVTFYAFSTENWRRPKSEVDTLMSLFKSYLLDAKDNFEESENMKIKFIGEKEGISQELLDLMNEAEEKTASHTGTTIFLAINYGGRQEILHAVKEICEDVKNGKSIDELTEASISSRIYTSEAPDADLIIRPSGEERLSNFLLWQAAYSEFYYSDVLWPDFKREDLYKALTEFENRNRRFGG